MATTPRRTAAALLFLVCMAGAPAEAQVTVVTGATVIDGTGRAPVIVDRDTLPLQKVLSVPR